MRRDSAVVARKSSRFRVVKLGTEDTEEGSVVLLEAEVLWAELDVCLLEPVLEAVGGLSMLMRKDQWHVGLFVGMCS